MSYSAALLEVGEEILRKTTVDSKGVTKETLKAALMDEEDIEALEEDKATLAAQDVVIGKVTIEASVDSCIGSRKIIYS